MLPWNINDKKQKIIEDKLEGSVFLKANKPVEW